MRQMREDPAGQVPEIIEILDTLGAELVYIYLTHCHADHINGVNELKKEKGGKVLIHRKGRENLENRVPVLAEYIGLPPALGFSPSTCVGLRYGYPANNSGFSWQSAHVLPYLFSVRVTSSDCVTDLPITLLPRLHRSFHSRLTLSACVPTVLLQSSTGISTCCPSTTPFGLALGPDLPRADQLYPGNLRYSAGRIPTFLSLLIPAFSLNRPRLLPVPLRPVNNAPSNT